MSQDQKVLDDKVKHLQLVNAVSSNDIDAVLNAIFRINATPSPPGTPPPAYGSPLHLVVSLCQKNVVENILGVFCSAETKSGKSVEWINVQNTPDRQTPLHIASKLARIDILDMLFQIPSLNDTVRDCNGQTAQDLSPNAQIEGIFEKYRTEFVTAMTSAMHNAAICGDHQRVELLFDHNERALSYLHQGWIDINGSLEAQTERSLLHIAAKMDNLELIAWGLKHGADPNVKDLKGKKPSELTKSDRVKEMLKHAKSQAPIHSPSLAQATTSASPSQKEAPFLKGFYVFNYRVLSKWTNYKDGYQPRYFVLEGGVLSYYQEAKDYPTACRGSISTLSADAIFPDISHDPSRFDITGSGNVKYSMKARSPADAKKWVWALKESRIWMADTNKPHSRQNSSHIAQEESVGASRDSFSNILTPMGVNAADRNEISLSVDAIEGGDTTDLFSFLEQQAKNEIHSTEMRRFLILLKTEMQVQKETVQSAVKLVNAAASTSMDLSLAGSMKDLPVLLSDSAQHIEALILGIVRYTNKREILWDQKLKRAYDAQSRMETIVKQLAQDPNLTPTAAVAVESIKLASAVPIPRKKTLYAMNDDEEEEEEEEFYDAQEAHSPGTAAIFDTIDHSHEVLFKELPPAEMSITKDSSVGVKKGNNSPFLDLNELKESCRGYETLVPRRDRLPLDPSLPKPSIAVWSFLKNAIGKDLSKVTLPVLFNEPISMLQRMCEDIEFIELLSLASRVGSKGFAPSKQLPDQPAEIAAKRLDLDYKKLEGLGTEDANSIRLMLVAAFAMSNYSSTAGRTNKPFNPMLGETFELIDPKKHYRYLSEQVCHHPPVSACYCDSPDYAFWTEVYVKSKFWGKSLELQPLGNCHVSLPVYDSNGNVTMEHYSWKKVTTLVNNLILGTLTIEHYGDMVITNHRTNEQCVITFKPKDTGGWFVSTKEPESLGGDLVGACKNSRGTPKYELSGRWDEVLIAKPLIPNGFSSSPFKLWTVNPKPPAAAVNFNLTAFSMSINQTSPELMKVLPLSDSRLRPDQRAMENGKWDEADREKERCESRQRQRRKEIVSLFDQIGKPYGPPARGESFGEKWWSPRWFIRETDKDTNEGHWRFSGEYWKVRNTATPSWPVYVEDTFGIT